MTNDELLLAISDIVGIHVGPLKSEMAELKQDVQELKEDVQELKQDVQGLKQDVQKLKQDVQELDQRVGKLEQGQQHTALILENDMQPRLQTIEACYTSTYYRYVEGLADMDRMKMDLSILKKVVEEHSDRFKKIS